MVLDRLELQSYVVAVEFLWNGWTVWLHDFAFNSQFGSPQPKQGLSAKMRQSHTSSFILLLVSKMLVGEVFRELLLVLGKISLP